MVAVSVNISLPLSIFFNIWIADKVSSEATVIVTPIPELSTTTEIRREENMMSGTMTTTIAIPLIECGPGKCSKDEICVSWEKHCGDSKCEASVELEYHECFPKEGDQWTKMNPTGGKLCTENETHKIMHKKQPCLKDKIPCNLHWWYKCVPETESPHSCANKKCPANCQCYEIVECDLVPPCMLSAKCDLCLGSISDRYDTISDQNMTKNTLPIT